MAGNLWCFLMIVSDRHEVLKWLNLYFVSVGRFIKFKMPTLAIKLQMVIVFCHLNAHISAKDGQNFINSPIFHMYVYFNDFYFKSKHFPLSVSLFLSVSHYIYVYNICILKQNVGCNNLGRILSNSIISNHGLLY